MMQIRLRPEYRGKVIAFALVVAVVALVLFMNGFSGVSEPQLDLQGSFHFDQTGSDIIHGIIFDAGSTGSRIHVIKLRKEGKGVRYVEELFEQIKPGLSDYANNPKQGVAKLEELLESAKNYIPAPQWGETPIALWATAGLRLLPGDQSQALLAEVSALFNKSPFKVGANAVQIMKGDDEGLFSWFTFNFLSDAFGSKEYISVMDLGGGSTQITFVPRTPEEESRAPQGYIIQKEVLGEPLEVYTHSYLGFGLMSGRLQTVGGSESGENTPSEYTSSCLGIDHTGKFKLGANEFSIKGKAAISSAYAECYEAAKSVVTKANIDKPPLLGTKQHKVALISYYYDRAVETDLIDQDAGGDITVQAYVESAQKVCEKPVKDQPFLCLDLCYISSLLQDGFGLPLETPVMLRKKIHGTEISWAMGAMFEVLKDPSKTPAPAAR